MKRNVPTYALWPVKHTPTGYRYLWACGHIDGVPHDCPKGPNRATLFQAPDIRRVRPAWETAKRFMANHPRDVNAETPAEDARRFAARRVA